MFRMDVWIIFTAIVDASPGRKKNFKANKNDVIATKVQRKLKRTEYSGFYCAIIVYFECITLDHRYKREKSLGDNIFSTN